VRQIHRQQVVILASLLAIALAASVLSGCHKSIPLDSAALYQQIYRQFLDGNLDGARREAEKARLNLSAARTANSPYWSVTFRLLEAEILLSQDEPGKAIDLLGCASTTAPLTGDVAIKWHLLCARSLSYVGRSEDSNRALVEARRLADSAHSALIGEVLLAEAVVQMDTGHLLDATTTFERSRAIAHQRGDNLLEATALVDIGFVSLQSGRYDQAVSMLQEADRFAKATHIHRLSQIAVGNLGWAFQNLGDFDAALTNFQAAERQARELGMTFSQVLWLQDAGLAEYKLGDLESARTYDERALKLAQTLPAAEEVDQVSNIEANLALLLFEQARYESATTYSDGAALTARNSKDDKVVAYAQFTQALVASRHADSRKAEDLLTQARHITSDPDVQADIAHAMANLYAGRHKTQKAELWYRRSIHTFENKRASVQDEALRLSAFGYGDQIYRDYASFLVDAHRPTEALRLLDRSRARTLEEGLGDTPGSPSKESKNGAGQQALARALHAPILFYSLGTRESYLWVITAHETRLFVLPGKKDIQPLVETYQSAIQKSVDPLQSSNPSGVALYKILIEPAAAMIGRSPRVILIPDGILYALNFDTLLKPAAGGFKYWIEDVAITTVSSMALLSRPRPVTNGTARKGLLVIGNPVAASAEFAALPNASAEIHEVQRHFAPNAQTVISLGQAVPTAYGLSAPKQFQYIHFVAHGTASRLSPLDSAVILSPPPGAPGEFKLYARDVVLHPLDAQLVTISACYGSGLRTYAGDGLVGLAWAFLRAGAHHVIGALWQADDSATPQLMDQLYGELAAGRSPDAALRTAKLALIHSPGVYRKPFYWGAFQLYAGS